MKIFVVEFTIFNGVYWKYTDYKITATSVEELKSAVLAELQWMREPGISVEDKWEQIQSHIFEDTLKFPIVQMNKDY
jgi:hypothetical protein